MKILIAVIPLLAGFLLDCLLGDPYLLPHPIRLIGRFIFKPRKMGQMQILLTACSGRRGYEYNCSFDIFFDFVGISGTML